MEKIVDILNQSVNEKNKFTLILIDGFLNNKKMFSSKKRRYLEIEKNFDFILTKINPDSKERLFEYFLNDERLKKLMIVNFELVIETCKSVENYYDLIYFFRDNNFLDEELSIIFVNKVINCENYFLLKQIYFDNTKNHFLKSIFQKFFDENKSVLIKTEVLSCLSYKKDFRNNVDVLYDDVYDFIFEKIFDELLDSEKIAGSDIKYLDEGCFSKVYEFGNKILKVGTARYNHEIPNNKAILQPLIRFNISKDNINFGYIEIMEKVITEEFSEEELYSLYKRFRDDGIYWLDAKSENMGRLIKDNLVYLNDQIIDVDQSVNGFNESNSDYLKAGELVAIDTDHFVAESDIENKKDKKEIVNLIGDLEIRYLEEKNQKRR